MYPYDSAKKGRTFSVPTLTAAEAEAILERQAYRCALTGLKFYSGTPGGFQPRMPTKDRIETDGPYSASNVRIVLHGVNALRGRGTDDEMYEVAAALLAWRDRARTPPDGYGQPSGYILPEKRHPPS